MKSPDAAPVVPATRGGRVRGALAAASPPPTRPTRLSARRSARRAGWSFRPRGGLERRDSGSVVILGIPYSEHSSWDDLRCGNGWQQLCCLPAWPPARLPSSPLRQSQLLRASPPAAWRFAPSLPGSPPAGRTQPWLRRPAHAGRTSTGAVDRCWRCVPPPRPAGRAWPPCARGAWCPPSTPPTPPSAAPSSTDLPTLWTCRGTAPASLATSPAGPLHTRRRRSSRRRRGSRAAPRNSSSSGSRTRQACRLRFFVPGCMPAAQVAAERAAGKMASSDVKPAVPHRCPVLPPLCLAMHAAPPPAATPRQAAALPGRLVRRTGRRRRRGWAAHWRPVGCTALEHPLQRCLAARLRQQLPTRGRQRPLPHPLGPPLAAHWAQRTMSTLLPWTLQSSIASFASSSPKRASLAAAGLARRGLAAAARARRPAASGREAAAAASASPA